MKYKNVTGKTINLKINKEWVSIAAGEVAELETQFEGLEKVKEVKAVKKAPKTKSKLKVFK